ncbi:Hsp33 family molecular chaperone HslO [Acetobacteraceae bacterium]|nr:Hsp33 family molecular chaperone HslO [Acetobacteraceae bacterium]
MSSYPSINLKESGSGRPKEIPNLTEDKAILPFYLQNAPVRGRFVRLGKLGNELLSRHRHMAVPTLNLTGKMAALTAGLATALKFDGSFTIQTKGDGPISMMASDCTNDGALRVTLQQDESKISKLSELKNGEASALLGAGYLAFTVQEKHASQPQQGIVQMTGESDETLAELAERYFKDSAQYPCHILLFSRHINNEFQSAALILERLPDDSQTRAVKDKSLTTEEIKDLWQTAVTLADTLKEDEALDPQVTPEALIYRLFGSLDVIANTFRSLSFGCRCTRQKIENMLKNFHGEQRKELIYDNKIEVDCHFCNIRFSFRPEELES